MDPPRASVRGAGSQQVRLRSRFWRGPRFGGGHTGCSSRPLRRPGSIYVETEGSSAACRLAIAGSFGIRSLTLASWRACGLRPGDELRLNTLPFFDDDYRVGLVLVPSPWRGRPRPSRAFGLVPRRTNLRIFVGWWSFGISGRSLETPLEVARRHAWQQAMWRVDREGNSESACAFGCMTVGRRKRTSVRFAAVARSRCTWASGHALRRSP